MAPPRHGAPPRRPPPPSPPAHLDRGAFAPLPVRGPPAYPAVALGKFDALHRGHRALARRAAAMGEPWMVSFAGMAEVLGWTDRLPVVAPCDRERVLELWSEDLGAPVRERTLPFADVRSLAPDAFVRDVLAEALGAGAVVCGENYRFGHRAAGDADTLVALGNAHGLCVAVETLVEDTAEAVSSTRVRERLGAGDVAGVATLLGRLHRSVVHVVPDAEGWRITERTNLLPANGAYHAHVALAPAAAQLACAPTVNVTVRLRDDKLVIEGAELACDGKDVIMALAVDFVKPTT